MTRFNSPALDRETGRRASARTHLKTPFTVKGRRNGVDRFYVPPAEAPARVRPVAKGAGERRVRRAALDGLLRQIRAVGLDERGEAGLRDPRIVPQESRGLVRRSFGAGIIRQVGRRVLQYSRDVPQGGIPPGGLWGSVAGLGYHRHDRLRRSCKESAI